MIQRVFRALGSAWTGLRSGFTADEPFGFTRDDVVALRVSGVWGFREWPEYRDCLDEEELAVMEALPSDWLEGLLARIEALLPPEGV